MQVGPDFEIRPYYAGHVLGAAMFYIRVGQQTLLYTGDYNMTPDRHLGSPPPLPCSLHQTGRPQSRVCCKAAPPADAARCASRGAGSARCDRLRPDLIITEST